MRRCHRVAVVASLLCLSLVLGGASQAVAQEQGFRDQSRQSENGWSWFETYRDLFTGRMFRESAPSCGGGICPPGYQCCCCGDECRCKRECSFQPCR